ncbi:uncharacterized protein si:ch211-234p6.5 isoform X2 [Myxocyprinus asiaticus]|uniref:uncharacterized protein si:ch211-234p6.5 isoform X2 n=1 Tax=Myxocyprinus asiaticus TaxID=70543 RepID=UPI00222291A5|nr:uncharacterized protein si:ch211-234p6.5 isoform X2 [Myxocyprinus asiaticus]
MTLEVAVGFRKQTRMEDQDRMSQASSIATVSFLPVRDKFHEKVQTFGKRCQAVKRDPNCPVVIRGWLYKRDSTGLKLWKRRWFVLSNYCLYYYKDSREESVLGSIPLPSYKILYCSPRECRNRKYAFKVVHQGMRPYILSADTQEDMLGWVRALSQSASMEADDIINRRCASFQDFTQMRGDTETMELQHTATFPERNAQIATKLTRVQTEPSLLDQHQMTPELRGRHETRQRASEDIEGFLNLRNADEEPLSFLFPKASLGTLPPFQYGSQYHGFTSRSDVLPLDNCSNSPLSPYIYTVASERGHLPDKTCSLCYCSNYQTSEHVTMCKTGQSDILMEREIQPIRDLENDTDVVLTRLCGCDKVLQSLSMQMAQLQADKKSVEYTLEMRWLEMEDGLHGEQKVSQKALLQEELVTLRARICDVSLEMERSWSDYERMESELSVFYSHLQHILHFGTPQEQCQAQRQLWMMEDILCGLRVNKNRFMGLLGLQTQGVPQPVSYFEGETGAHNMDCVTEMQHQDFMKTPQSCKRWPQESSAHESRTTTEHDTTESLHEPLRLTRVLTTTLPTALIAERIFVEDPPPELQISQQSGLKNSKRSTPKKPSRMLHEMADKNRNIHWADVSEERPQKKSAQNSNSRAKDKELSTMSERKGWAHQQHELEPGALSLTNSESDCEPAATNQKRETKLRQMEHRVLSAAREKFIDDIHPLKLITANEKETDIKKYTSDSAVPHVSSGYRGDGCKSQNNSKLTVNSLMPQCDDARVHTELEDMSSHQSPSNDIIVIESHSINHISTLTVFKGHQGNNHTNKPQKKNRSSDRQKFSVSTNLKSECFLSNKQWCESVPVCVHDPKPQVSIPSVEHQQSDQECNQTLASQIIENISSSAQSNLSETVHPTSVSQEPNVEDCVEETTFFMAKLNQTNGKGSINLKEVGLPNQQPDTQTNQTTTTSDNQLMCASDQSKLEHRIYEEIQFSSPRSKDVNRKRNTISGDEIQLSNLTVHDDLAPSHSLNYKAASEVNGEYSTINTEEKTCQEVSKSRTGSDVTCKRGKGQKIYSSITKSSVVVNHHVQDCRPRITMVSTSL